MSWCSNRTQIRGVGDGRFIATVNLCPRDCEVATILPNEAPKGPEQRPCVISWRVSRESKIRTDCQIFGLQCGCESCTFHSALSSHFPDGRATLPGPQPGPPVRLGFPVRAALPDNAVRRGRPVRAAGDGLTSGYDPPSPHPQRLSHPDYRLVLTFIVARHRKLIERIASEKHDAGDTKRLVTTADLNSGI
jgi:hypothetical protein